MPLAAALGTLAMTTSHMWGRDGRDNATSPDKGLYCSGEEVNETVSFT
jgi:hypothetical protein